MEDKVIQILVQGGLAGVAISTLAVLYKLVGNHIDHNTKALENLSSVLTRLDQFLKDKIK
ncbi:hypothetical protein HY469_02525 [Candidatus Roizmanbacteria bacterium]|nr:hypothetical protein [Candidatus Roizmanbacteria bacterium]